MYIYIVINNSNILKAELFFTHEYIISDRDVFPEYRIKKGSIFATEIKINFWKINWTEYHKHDISPYTIDSIDFSVHRCHSTINRFPPLVADC